MSRSGPGRLLLAVAVAFGVLVLTPTPSWACSCAMASTAEHVRMAGTVATGTVDWTATDGQTRTYQVSVDRVFKGAAGTTEKLRTSATDAACGLGDLATGKRYLFFIEGRHPGSMRVGLCGGTAAYDDELARQVEAATGPPGRPIPVRTAVADDGTDHTAYLVAGAFVVLAAVAVGAVVARRRT